MGNICAANTWYVLILVPLVFLQPSILKAQVNPLITHRDTIQGESLSDVVITGSRIRESLLRSPTSIQKAGKAFFQNSSAPSFFDGLENLKGVQMITPSMGFRILNTRGFANTTNVRFAQLVDGMDVQSPHIGSPIGNALGPGDLDIDKVEIVPGVAASLYGMNAISGLADFVTKNPFDHQGLSVQQKLALSHLGHDHTNIHLFSETSIRYAKTIGSKWAFKINGTYIRGYDWEANDYTDLNSNANISTGLTGEYNPAKDPVNSYGNESPNQRTLMLQGLSYVVSRTGYAERDVTAYDLQNFKGDLSVYLKPSAHSQLSYRFRGALLDNVYQRANRFRLADYFVQQHALVYERPAFSARIYLNNEHTGRSYNLRSMAENLDRVNKTDHQWFSDYTMFYNNSVGSVASAGQAHQQARLQADAGRLQPGSSEFRQALSALQDINNWDSGAALRVRAGFVQAELQWNLSDGLLKKFATRTGMQILAGADHRTYLVKPDGNYFINPEPGKNGKTIFYGKTGLFFTTTREFANKTLRLGAALRADKNDYYPMYWSPRFTAVYSPVKQHNFRASWQMGYRFPVLFEAFSNVNSGGVKRVGGLPVMSNGIFENAWLQSSVAGFQSSVLRDLNNGMVRHNAIERNKRLLQKNPYTYVKPEQVRSVEIGYKGFLFASRLFIDADIYFNNYRNFIAQANMNLPNTSNPDSIPYALYERSRQSPYRMWTNSLSNVYNYGFSIGLNHKLPSNFMLGANASFAKLVRSDNQDGLEDGFNTPAWMINLTLANPQLTKHWGAGLTWRWQSSFYWQSFLVSGQVPAYGSFDMHLNYRFLKSATIIKAGASNLFNQYYHSFLGGPSVGGFYYVTCSLTLPE